MLPTRFALFTALFLSFMLPAHAGNAGLDRRFGGDGLVSLREPTAVNARDLGIAACAGPGNTLNVISATFMHQLAMFRLKSDGSLDTSFGENGIAIITVPESGEDMAQGACMADGRIVVVRMSPGAGTDRNMQLIRVHPTGEIDTAFGVGGTRVIDFDNYEPGLGDLEMPMALNLMASNDIVVSSRIFLGNGQSRPGITRVDVNGSIAYSRIIVTDGVTPHYASGAGLGPDGRLWVVGGGNPTNAPYNGWFLAELDPGNGITLETIVGSEGNYIVDGARMLASGIMVAVGKYVPQSEPGGAYRPRLMVFRNSGFSEVVLPTLTAVNNFTPSLAPYPGLSFTIPTTDGRVLVSAPMGGQNGQWEIATYVAQIELGASAAEDRVDTRFGNNGAIQFAFHAEAPCANGSPPLQRIVRASNWLGAPVLVGIHATGCPTNPRNTMVAKLLTGNDVFFDGME